MHRLGWDGSIPPHSVIATHDSIMHNNKQAQVQNMPPTYLYWLIGLWFVERLWTLPFWLVWNLKKGFPNKQTCSSHNLLSSLKLSKHFKQQTTSGFIFYNQLSRHFNFEVTLTKVCSSVYIECLHQQPLINNVQIFKIKLLIINNIMILSFRSCWIPFNSNDFSNCILKFNFFFLSML